MPIRDYKCDTCEHQFEHLSQTIKRTCPACGQKSLKVIFLKPPAAHNRYSPMHPRKNRGRGW